jgi:eukaryotic translation initiation factor 2C
VPLEVCYVPPGQFYKKPLPAAKSADVVRFATTPPAQRIDSIRKAFGVLKYGGNEYLESFEITVDAGETSIPARQLTSPVLLTNKNKQLVILRFFSH